jgi:hypothetical protein
MMYKLLLALMALSLTATAAKPKLTHPFEKAGGVAPVNEIDVAVLVALKQKGVRPANLCSDSVFIRRVYLDVIGTIPEPHEVRKFLADKRPDKRAVLIENVLKREEFAGYWTLKWCDLLRVKAEFPINLWPNGVQAYHRWIRDAIRTNMPYDQFARELLTSSGSNFRVPQVNFYRAVQSKKPEALAAAAALNFMGVRLDKWPADRRKGIEVLFSRVAYKGTAEWKEEIVYLDPKPTGSVEAQMPDGTTLTVSPGSDPRKAFADWLIQPKNPWFTRNIVNRAWSWLLGRGLIHEVDDIRPDNPAVHPEVLTFLEHELVESGYDLKHLFRFILNSRTYQQSSIPQGDAAQAEKLFACYPVRRLDAEVLIDALCWISGTNERYTSVIPEPFTFIPMSNRSIELADGSITSQFLKMFGRPARDTGLESERDNKPSGAQRLHLLNSSHIQKKIERSWRLKSLLKGSKRNPEKLCSNIYLNILSRYPTPAERVAAMGYFKTTRNHHRASVDLVWALINSKEFLYRH